MSQSNPRLTRFNEYEQHLWLRKAFKKLSAAELTQARDFLTLHADLDRGAFEMAVNRMFLNQPRSKNWAVIQELLSSANSSLPR